MTKRQLLWIAAFVLANALAVNALLAWSVRDTTRGALKPTTLSFTKAWFSRDAGTDSWFAMRQAHTYLHRHHTTPLYTKLLLGRGVKFQYPPTSLVVIEPFFLIPGLGGDDFLNAISWLAVLALAWITGRIFLLAMAAARAPGEAEEPGEHWIALGLALVTTLTFYPVMRGYHIGQIQAWINPLFAGAVWAWMLGRARTSGALFGAICAVKPALALLVLWGLLRRQWQFLVGFGAVFGGLSLLALTVYGWADCVDYLSALSYLGRHGESFHQNQSVNGLLHRMFFNGNNLVWAQNQFPPYHAGVYAGTIVSSLLLVGLALFWRPADVHTAPLEDLLIAATSFTLAAPIVWDHHYGVALPIFAVAIPAALALPKHRTAALAALGFAFVLLANRYRLFEATAPTSFNFVQSNMLVGGLVLLVTLYRLRRARTPAPALTP